MSTFRFEDGDTVGYIQGSTLKQCEVMRTGSTGKTYLCHDMKTHLSEDDNDKLQMRLVKRAKRYGGSRKSRRMRKNKRKTRRTRK
jgi:hypothetical protein